MKKTETRPTFLRDVDELCLLTAESASRLISKKTISISDYLSSLIKQIKKAEKSVNAWQYIDYELAHQYVIKLEKEFSEKPNVSVSSPLYGIPFGIKDIFNTIDMPTQHGSVFFSNYMPGNDARVVTDLKRAGAVPLGKTVTAEFAVHKAGVTKNPLDLERSCGTSSSGSAAAVASFMVPIALSSQTASSTIRPASYCGVYGYKPSFGLLPRTAMLKTTDTLDTVGIMARSVVDLKTTFERLRVEGDNYPVINREMLRPERKKKKASNWCVGILEGPKSNLEEKDVKLGISKVAKLLSDEGCDVRNIKLPSYFDDAHHIHSKIYNKCLSYYFKTEWNSDPSKISKIMTSLIEDGLKTSKEEYLSALSVQIELAKLLDEILEEVDLLICPSAASEAPIGINSIDIEDHSLIWTMCHCASITVPILKGKNGLPIGVQVVSRRFNDYIALDFADYLGCLMD